MVYKNSITFIGEIKGDILVSLLTTCSTIEIPHINDLAIFDEWSKSLTKSINKFTNTQVKLLRNIEIFASIFVLKVGIGQTLLR